MASSFAPTEEQQLIIDDVKAGLNVHAQAFAGCTKSTTLELSCRALKPQPLMILVFNNRNKKELEEKVPAWVQVSTLNGLGHRAWSSAIGKPCTPDAKKVGKLVSELLREAKIESSMETWSAVRELCEAAMTAGIVHKDLDPEQTKGLLPDDLDSWLAVASDKWLEGIGEHEVELAREVLRRSTMMAYQGQISFDDQVYCSALLGGKFNPTPLLMVDEAQDLSPLNHLQVKKQARERIVVVGDRHQAIYGWRGASHGSMDRLRGLRTSWSDRTLSMTFRCPQSHVRRASSHALGFRAAPQNAEGQIADFRQVGQPIDPDAASAASWTWPQITALSRGREVAILCRNNAPLVKMAFRLIRRGVGCQVLGREIGKGLTALAKKLLDGKAEGEARMTAAPAALLIREWADAQMALARATDNDSKADKIADQSECLLAVLETAGIKYADELGGALDRLFDPKSARVILSSGHKAKGLEWEVVVHLDPWRVPSRWANEAALKGDDRSLIQELNLKYVIETRSKDVLVLADLEDFK